MDLIDDDYEEKVEERKLPTEEQKTALKDYAISLVKGAGGKLDFAKACKLCHEQFPGVFTWGELESLLLAIQSNWDEKRNIKIMAKQAALLAANEEPKEEPVEEPIK